MKERFARVSPFLWLGALLAPLYLITDRFIVSLPEWVIITIIAVQVVCVGLGAYFSFRKKKD